MFFCLVVILIALSNQTLRSFYLFTPNFISTIRNFMALSVLLHWHRAYSQVGVREVQYRVRFVVNLKSNYIQSHWVI